MRARERVRVCLVLKKPHREFYTMPWVFRAYSRVRIHAVGTLPKSYLLWLLWQCGLVPNSFCMRSYLNCFLSNL